MTGRYELLQKINQNTFSTYVAPGRDLQIAFISGPIQTIHGQITYISFGCSDPLLTLPLHLKDRITFRTIEGLSGLIGAIKKDESQLLFIQYSREYFEEYERSIPILADECKVHARHIAPVVILSVRHDHIIEELGIRSDRYIILSDKNRRFINGKKHKDQKTLDESPSSPCIFSSAEHTIRYGQQSLVF